jgi:predicted acylesterase/phospholipase RssA
MTPVERRLKLARPKRLLSIDGGGIRGIVAAQILKRVETIICNKNSRWQCLADYFDFIGGTSTGSIIAAGLAKGMKVDEILNLYKNNGSAIFQKNELTQAQIIEFFSPYIQNLLDNIKGVPMWEWWVKNYVRNKIYDNLPKALNEYQDLLLQLILGAKYNQKPLEDILKEKFPDIRLGSEELKTLLMITVKNTTTDRMWFFVNNPPSEFFNTNKDILLSDIVRASSAAPTYFPPHCIKVGDKEYGFIDGGMSAYNNPSLQLFLEATKKDYQIGWETGTDKLLMISVGTGFSNDLVEPQKVKDYKLLDWAKYTVGILMDDVNAQQNILMKIISKTPNPEQINREMSAFSMPVSAEIQQQLNFTPLLTYHRYTTSFTQERFQKLGLPPDINPESVKPMDCVAQIESLCKIGEAVAKQQVSDNHFKGFWDDDY